MVSEDLLLAKGAVYKKIKKGEFIFKEGAKCSYYFQLVSGMVSWINFDEEGKVFIQSIIHPGECFGELPLFDDEPYAANSIAETDSVLIQLPKTTFHQLLKERQDLLMAFTRLLAQRVRYKFLVLREFASHDPEHLIITLLNFYREKYHSTSSEPFKLNLTRQQLADMTGLRVETVIRVIKKLSDKGKLSIQRGKVFLLNPDSNHKCYV
jgi:CRP/FNR family cyclic AMP-dependent transcriptional regulator